MDIAIVSLAVASVFPFPEQLFLMNWMESVSVLPGVNVLHTQTQMTIDKVQVTANGLLPFATSI